MKERAMVGCQQKHPEEPSSVTDAADGGSTREPREPSDPSSELRLWGAPRPGRVRRGARDGPGSPLAGYQPEELFGRAVHYLRLGRRLRLVDLAPRASMSVPRLSAIENGKYPHWRGSADDVARALDFPDAEALLRAFYGADYPPAEGAPGPAGPADPPPDP